MNERIRELREQAFDWVQNQLHTLGSDHQVTQDQQLQMVNEKFAELIVRECADIADINAHQNEPPGSYVRQHFGVK